jgi:pseudouridine-5'-phosphate glycosidase
MVAHRAGIKVFATGGIGGVHRGFAADVSADLVELSRTPIVVVCSGPKAILELAATREWLETYGITILGWRCDEMPAFYAVSSGLAVDERVETAGDVAEIAAARDDLGMSNAVLVTVPPPPECAIDAAELEGLLAEAIAFAGSSGIRGKELTPFLLARLAGKTEGRTLAANIALLENNARIAAAIAAAIADRS